MIIFMFLIVQNQTFYFYLYFILWFYAFSKENSRKIAAFENIVNLNSKNLLKKNLFIDQKTILDFNEKKIKENKIK
jgi:hypothetical protein